MNKEEKEFCCSLKALGINKIWYFDTYEEACNKLKELESTVIQDIQLYAGKTVNVNRTRAEPIVLTEEHRDFLG